MEGSGPPPLNLRTIMKAQLVEKVELVALVSIFISSVYAISPLV
jgi:hypothetical protein